MMKGNIYCDLLATVPKVSLGTAFLHCFKHIEQLLYLNYLSTTILLPIFLFVGLNIDRDFLVPHLFMG